MPVENSRSPSTSGKVYVDHVYVTENTGILCGPTQDAKFVEIIGDPTYRCGVPLSGLAFLMAPRSTFICLMKRHNGYWEDGYCPRAVVGE
jgi:hypothetical protein